VLEWQDPCSKASSDCPCFLPVKNCRNAPNFFSWRGLAHFITPTAPHPFLTEILNTPLIVGYKKRRGLLTWNLQDVLLVLTWQLLSIQHVK